MKISMRRILCLILVTVLPVCGCADNSRWYVLKKSSGQKIVLVDENKTPKEIKVDDEIYLIHLVKAVSRKKMEDSEYSSRDITTISVSQELYEDLEEGDCLEEQTLLQPLKEKPEAFYGFPPESHRTKYEI